MAALPRANNTAVRPELPSPGLATAKCGINFTPYTLYHKVNANLWTQGSVIPVQGFSNYGNKISGVFFVVFFFPF